jgi:hypothetical protein
VSDGPETGLKWWLRYVFVPLIGGGGIIAIIAALISQPGATIKPAERASSTPTVVQKPEATPEVQRTPSHHKVTADPRPAKSENTQETKPLAPQVVEQPDKPDLDALQFYIYDRTIGGPLDRTTTNYLGRSFSLPHEQKFSLRWDLMGEKSRGDIKVFFTYSPDYPAEELSSEYQGQSDYHCASGALTFELFETFHRTGVRKSLGEINIRCRHKNE